MCDWTREPVRRREGAIQPETLASDTRVSFPRPRVLAGVAAAVAAVAAAAMMLPSGAPDASSQASATRAAPAAIPAARESATAVAARESVASGSGGTVEQTAAGVDDGVPSSSDVARTSRIGGCSHDL